MRGSSTSASATLLDETNGKSVVPAALRRSAPRVLFVSARLAALMGSGSAHFPATAACGGPLQVHDPL